MRSPALPTATNAGQVETRYDSGQFRTDSRASAAHEIENRSENGQFRTDFPKTDWSAQAELFRQEEWALYLDIVRAARSVTEAMADHPRRVSLSQLANVLLIASTLGRRACGMPIDDTPAAPPPPRSRDPQLEEALRRIYGRDGIQKNLDAQGRPR